MFLIFVAFPSNSSQHWPNDSNIAINDVYNYYFEALRKLAIIILTYLLLENIIIVVKLTRAKDKDANT